MPPFAPNTFFAIFRSGGFLPSPDPEIVALFPGLLRSAFDAGQQVGSAVADCIYTHVLAVEIGIEVRDGFDDFTVTGGDRIFVPDENGQGYAVIFVQRAVRDGPNDHQQVFLRREAHT